MIIKLEVEYDTKTGEFVVKNNSQNNRIFTTKYLGCGHGAEVDDNYNSQSYRVVTSMLSCKIYNEESQNAESC